MPRRTNEFDQPIGCDVSGWTAKKSPPNTPIEGRYCRIERLDASRHARDLFDAFNTDCNEGLWTYMPVGPFNTLDAFEKWMVPACDSQDPLFIAIVDRATDRAVGFASYLRIVPQYGVIEVGFIAFSPLLQRTPSATEAMYLMMRRVFNELGYRRYEWKCDALNAPSRSAAVRLGFKYDGLFEQALIYKGRNRDTAWYSILDRDWPPLEQAYEAWLNPVNFDTEGQQMERLADLIAKSRKSA